MKKLIVTGAMALAVAAVGIFNGAQEAKSEEKVFAQRNNQVVGWLALINDRYVSVAGNTTMRANATRLRSRERFTARVLANNRVAFRRGNRYVSSENGRRSMRANRNRIGSFERFQVVPSGRSAIGFRGNNNRFVSSERGRRAMRCNRGALRSFEQFLPFSRGGVIPL